MASEIILGYYKANQIGNVVHDLWNVAIKFVGGQFKEGEPFQLSNCVRNRSKEIVSLESEGFQID